MPSSNAWKRISSDCDRIRCILDNSRASHTSQVSTRAPCTSSQSFTIQTPFPQPQPIASDLIALGVNYSTAHQLSITFVRAANSLKQEYEAHSNRVAESLINGLAFTIPSHHIRSVYISHFSGTIDSWASKQLHSTRLWLMKISLNAKSPFDYHGLHNQPPLAVTEPEEFDRSSPFGVPSHNVQSERNGSELDQEAGIASRNQEPDGINLTPLFQTPRSSSEGDDPLHKNLSTYAFPKAYPCPSPVTEDSCFKILSHGFQRAICQPSSKSVSVGTLVESFARFSTFENLSTVTKDDAWRLPPSPPDSFSPAVSSPPSPPPLFLSCSPRSQNLLSFPHREIVKIPKRAQTFVNSQVPDQMTSTSTPTSSPCASQASFSKASLLDEQSERPTLSIAISPMQSPSPALRRRKVAPLPTKRVSTISKPALLPALPTASPEPLSMANVSLLSRHAPASGRSRSIISRTPSLVSLASSDSGSTSPSSDGLDTPPSTPPPFITKFSSSISSSPLPSRSFLSPGSVLRFSSDKKPKVESVSPSEPVSTFSFSTGIKSEGMSFSFAFGRS
uniref:B2 mating type protein n=1 Tax=Heterobasidion annosum TaxID=13563 RepID=S5REZ3_HETAN|nr:b2 mating type protein [Heterobasidion annosum]